MADKKPGLIDRALKLIGLRKDTREDVIPPGWVLRDTGGYTIGGLQEVPPAPPDFLDEYRRSLFAYACVSAKGRAAAGVPYVLKREKDGDDDVVTDHPVLDLLENPGPDLTWSTLVENLVAHLELVGTGYWEKVRGKREGEDGEAAGPLRQLLVLYPDRMKTIIKPKEGVVGYEYRPNWNTRPIPFKPSDVARFNYIDPGREFVGSGAMGPAFMSSRMDTASTRWNASFFNNGAHPDIIMSTDKPMPPEERKRLKNEYVEPQKGPSKGRGVYFAPYGLKVDLFGANHREMQFERLKKSVREEICAAFRVPPVLIGMDTSSYAASSVQLQVFRDYVLVPLMRYVFSVIKRSIIDEYEDGEDLYLDVDLSEMKQPEERDRDYNRALTWFQAGLLDENEARAMANIPPLTPAQIKEREKKKAEAQMAAQGAPPGFGQGQPKSKEQVAKPDTKDVQPKVQGADEAEDVEEVEEPADQAVPKKKKKKKPEDEKEAAGKNGTAGKNGAAKKSDDGLYSTLRKRASGIPWDDILGAEEEAEE